MSLHLYQRASHQIGSARNEDGGFTVLEVVVAMTIFMVVGGAAATAIVGGIHATNTTDNRIGGTNIAQSDLEQARAQITPAPTSYPTAASTGGPSYQVTRTVTMPKAGTVATPCPDGQEMTVTTKVTGPGSANTTVQMDTVIAC